jgi:hypothetical protein
MLVWAVGTIFSALLVASVFSSAVSGVAQIGAAVTNAAASAAGSAASAAGANTDVTDYFNDMLFRSQQSAPADAQASKAEVGRIVARSIASGELSSDDKTYVAQVIARQTGLSEGDATKRIDEVLAKAKDTAQQVADKAKVAVDAGRKAAAYAALWAFVALLVGGLSASYLATVGGRLRDDLPAM